MQGHDGARSTLLLGRRLRRILVHDAAAAVPASGPRRGGPATITNLGGPALSPAGPSCSSPRRANSSLYASTVRSHECGSAWRCPVIDATLPIAIASAVGSARASVVVVGRCR